MTTVKPLSQHAAKAICDRAISLVTGALASTDWTAPGMWEAARKDEAADDRRYYRGGNTVTPRKSTERDANLVLAMLTADQYTLTTLYGVRAAFVKAVLIGNHHAPLLRGLGIDTVQLSSAIAAIGSARRGDV